MLRTCMQEGEKLRAKSNLRWYISLWEFSRSPLVEFITTCQSPRCAPLVCEKFAENPEFCVGNFAVSLKREIKGPRPPPPPCTRTLPPLVQATVNDQKLTEPTPSVGWTRVLLTHRNLRDTRVDMMYYSENQEAKHATNALLANRAALTQIMNIVHLKTKASGGTHGTQ